MNRSKQLICLTAFLLAVLTGCRQAESNPLTEQMFRVAVEKQFSISKQRVESLQMASLFTPPVDPSPVLFAQTENGNAAELYWAALKGKIDPRAGAAQQFLEQIGPLVQIFDLAMKEGLTLGPSTIEDAKVKAEAEKAAEIPELAKFEAGARRKYSRLVGEVIPVPDNVLSLQLVPLSVLKSYAAALMARAMVKEAAGEKAAAETAMQTIIAIGQHFSQDPAYAHYFTGQSIMKFGCFGLKSFYKRNGNTAKQQAVEQFEKALDDQATRLTQLAARDDSGQNFNVLKSLGYLDEGIDTLTRIATDESVPVAFRAGAIENMFSGYIFRYLMVERSGRPPETSDYAPPSDLRLKALERLSTLSDKTLAQMASKSQQVLAKMKGLSSGERMKYWRELSAAKT